jgi:hypothetical protein
MAILKKTALRGRVDALLLHRTGRDDITSESVDSVQASFAGFEGESHSGLTRESCVRVKQQYPVGTSIRNTRQISMVSLEELQQVAKALDIAAIAPAWLGANIGVSGIPDFTSLPPSSRLIFEGGVSLVIDMENEPCVYPARVIDGHYPGHGKHFVKHAKGRRGITAWVEREGQLSHGEFFTVHMPSTRPYPAAE